MKTGEPSKKRSGSQFSDLDKKWILKLRAKGYSVDKIAGFFTGMTNRTAIYLYLKSLPGYRPLRPKRGAIV